MAREGFGTYKLALEAVTAQVARCAPDLIPYQAGVDCHENDPKSRAGLSTLHPIERDRFVFRMARQMSIPILSVVAGGYQNSSIRAQLNGNTAHAALEVFG